MYPELPRPSGPRRSTILLIVAIFLLFAGARFLANYAIEYQWWKEMGQVPTWIEMLTYSIAPVTCATLIAFLFLFFAHARGLRFAGTRLREHRLYAGISTILLLAFSWILASSTIDTWTVVRFFGGRNLPATAAGWSDSIFGLPLRFYLFDLPFYTGLRRYLLGL